MIACLIILYAVPVLLLFKLKLLKPRPYPIACTVVVGVFLIGGVVVAWMLCAPMSGDLVTSQYVIQLVPYVKGQVKTVHALANQPIKKGALLLEINPAPYQYTVNQLEAQLEAAKENVNQTQAGLESAKANVQKAKDGVVQSQAALDQAKAGVNNAVAMLNKAKADDDKAKTQEQIALSIQKENAGAISVLQVNDAVQNRLAADAAVKQANAGVNEAKAAQAQAQAALTGAQSSLQQAEAAARQAEFTLKVAQSNVPVVQAQLDDARFNLDQCKMLAPTDGYVVNWEVQEGTMLVALPIAPAGTFVNTSDTFVVASFPQNYLTNVQPGDDVELILDPYPGKLFKGKVDTIIPASGGGQFVVSGKIPNAASLQSFGLYAVKILLTDEAGSPQLPMGSGGNVAIYTKVGKPVHIISKVVIRMKKWLLYVLPSVKKP